jgi:hypothetical protein
MIFWESLCFCMIPYDSACKFVFEALFFHRGSDSLQAPPNQGANHPYRAREAEEGCRVQV